MSLVDITDTVVPAQDGDQEHDEIETTELPPVGNPDLLAFGEEQPTIPPPAIENSTISTANNRKFNHSTTITHGKYQTK